MGICPRNVTVLTDLIDLSSQMIDALHNNRPAKKLVEKFQMRLQGLSFIDSTQGSVTQASVTQASVTHASVTDVNGLTSDEGNGLDEVSKDENSPAEEKDIGRPETDDTSDVNEEEIFSQGKNLKSAII